MTAEHTPELKPCPWCGAETRGVAQVDYIDLPVLDEDNGKIMYVRIPKLSQEAFDFLKEQIERFKPAITKPQDKEVPDDPDNDCTPSYDGLRGNL